MATIALLLGAVVVDVADDATPAAAEALPPVLVREWGVVSETDADLLLPSAIVVAPTGEVVVGDGNRGIKIYDRDGNYDRRWDLTAPRHMALAPDGRTLYLLASNCTVTAVDLFDEAVTPARSTIVSRSCVSGDGLAVGPGGDVLVLERRFAASANQSFVRRYNPQGSLLSEWGGSATFDWAGGLAVDAAGRVYVSDQQQDTVQAFDAAGTPLPSWGDTANADGQFQFPQAMASAPDGSVLVFDLGRSDVQRFDADGNLLGRFGKEGDFAGGFPDRPLTGSSVPVRIAVDPVSGDVFTTDPEAQHVQRLTSTGAVVGVWGFNVHPDRVIDPRGMATDAAGRVYVSVRGSHRVDVFSGEGVRERSWNQADNADGVLHDPGSIAIAPDGDVLVIDRGHDLVQRYHPDGELVEGWSAFGATSIEVTASGEVVLATAATVRVLSGDGALLRTWALPGAPTATITSVAMGADGLLYAAVGASTTGTAWVLDLHGALVRQWDLPYGDGDLAGHPSGDIFFNSCATTGRYTATGEVVAEWNRGSTSWRNCGDLAVHGSNVYVGITHAPTTAGRGDRVVQYHYPAGPAATIAVTAEQTDVIAGTTVDYEVTVANVGDAPLTATTTSSVELPDCARSHPDVPVGETYTYQCAHAPTAGDAGRFSATVSVSSTGMAAVQSASVVVDVSGFGAPKPVRAWAPSATSMADGDPLTEVGGLDTDESGVLYVVGSREYPEPATPRFQRFEDGMFVGGWGEAGREAGQINLPSGVADTPDGDVWVSECEVWGRLQRFDAVGQLEWSRDAQVATDCRTADVAVGPSGTVYVANAGLDRIDLVVGDTLAAGWGETGEDPGQFERPVDVEVAGDGTVYVLDRGNARVQRFTAEGDFLDEWGSGGFANGQFTRAARLAIDASGRVFVLDDGRVQVFTAEGDFLGKWATSATQLAVHESGDGSVRVFTSGEDGVIEEAVFAPQGFLAVTFTGPPDQQPVGATISWQVEVHNRGGGPLTGVAVDGGDLTGCTVPLPDLAPGGSAEVTCTEQATTPGRIRRAVIATSDQTGSQRSNNAAVEVELATLGTTGAPGAAPGQLSGARGVAVTGSGDLWVADCGNDRVQRFTTDGQFVDQWGQSGAGEGQLDCPVDVTGTEDGDLLVVEQDQQRVQQFTAEGEFVRSWATGTSDSAELRAVDADDDGNVYVTDFESHSFGEPCSFNPATGGTDCTLYPPGPTNNRVRRFTSSGEWVATWGGYPQITSLSGLWITSDDRAVVGHGSFVRDYTLTGQLTQQFVQRHPTPTGCERRILDVAVDPTGIRWVVSCGFVGRYSPGGTLLATYEIPAARTVTVDQENVYVSTGGTIVKLGPPPVPTVPSVSGPPRSLQTKLAFNVAWGGSTDADGVVVGYDVRYRRAGRNGVFGAEETWQTATTATSARFTGAPAKTYCFSARAIDDDGGTSDWSTERCIATPIDDRALAARGFTRRLGSGNFQGTFSKATRTGATLTSSPATGRTIGVLVHRCPTCGRVKVRFGDQPLGTIDLTATTTQRRQLVTFELPATTTGTFKLRVTSAGSPVRIDGVVVAARPG